MDLVTLMNPGTEVERQHAVLCKNMDSEAEVLQFESYLCNIECNLVYFTKQLKRKIKIHRERYMNFAPVPLCRRTQNTIYFMGSLYGLNKWIHVKHISISHMVRIRYFVTEQVTFPKSCSYFIVESGFICSLSNFKVQTLFSLSPDNAWLISKPIVQTRISRGAQS